MIPTSPATFTPGWLAEKLGAAPDSLRDFTARPLGTGQMCDSFRLTLDWNGPGLGPADAAALHRHCAERLADHKVPENIKWRAARLRRHANGKVMKRLRREPH